MYTPSTLTEDNLYKQWLRVTMKADRGWLGISIANKTATTTVADVTWQDGTEITKSNISYWIEADLPKYIA